MRAVVNFIRENQRHRGGGFTVVQQNFFKGNLVGVVTGRVLQQLKLSFSNAFGVNDVRPIDHQGFGFEGIQIIQQGFTFIAVGGFAIGAHFGSFVHPLAVLRVGGRLIGAQDQGSTRGEGLTRIQRCNHQRHNILQVSPYGASQPVDVVGANQTWRQPGAIAHLSPSCRWSDIGNAQAAASVEQP